MNYMNQSKWLNGTIIFLHPRWFLGRCREIIYANQIIFRIYLINIKLLDIPIYNINIDMSIPIEPINVDLSNQALTYFVDLTSIHSFISEF